MIWQRQRGVADPGRKQLHQHCGDRAVHHRHVDDQDREDPDHHRLVDLRRVGLGRVAGRLDGLGQRLLELGRLLGRVALNGGADLGE